MLKRIVLGTAVLVYLPAIAQAQIAGRLGSATFESGVRASATSPSQAVTATDAPIIVGGFLGAQLDTSDDWFFFGGDARLRVQGRSFEINPRLAFQPFEGGNTLQIDVNVLVELELAVPNRFRPYVGLGGAVVRSSFDGDSDTSVGLNLAGGVRLDMEGRTRLEPFAHVQYTIVRDQLNPFTISVGVSIPLR